MTKSAESSRMCTPGGGRAPELVEDDSPQIHNSPFVRQILLLSRLDSFAVLDELAEAVAELTESK